MKVIGSHIGSESIIEISVRYDALIANACTRFNTQKAQCDRTIPDVEQNSYCYRKLLQMLDYSTRPIIFLRPATLKSSPPLKIKPLYLHTKSSMTLAERT